MTTTHLIEPSRSPQPTFGEMLEETIPLIGVIPVAGPAAVLVAAPWLFFVLLLAGSFALLLTVVAVLTAAASLVRLIRATLVASYRFVR
jgi:hypothetical protein